MTVVGQVEIDPYCRSVLAKHWPGVPRHDDVRTALAWWRAEPRPEVDLIAGGYPCQPESTAGRRRGTADERWLWPEFATIVAALQPRYVLGENVMGHRTSGLRFVLADLEQLGYTARAGVVGAQEVGAPHRRARIFVLAGLADPAGEGLEGPRRIYDQETERESGSLAAHDGWWAIEPAMGRVAHGVPGRVDRLRALGNAVVPQVAQFVAELLLSGTWLDE